MADKLVPFFNPADVLALGGTWIQQENNLADSVSRAQGLGATGDEAASQTYDGKTSGTLVYESHAETVVTPALVLPQVGWVLGRSLVDSWTLAYSMTGWPKLTVTVHQHDANVHADATLNEFTTTIIFPAQFGIPVSLTLVATGTAWSFTDTDVGMRSLSYTLGCTHVDESDGT